MPESRSATPMVESRPVVRAVYDIGSGSTKLLVAMVRVFAAAFARSRLRTVATIFFRTHLRISSTQVPLRRGESAEADDRAGDLRAGA